jgi:hypothetical protein
VRDVERGVGHGDFGCGDLDGARFAVAAHAVDHEKLAGGAVFNGDLALSVVERPVDGRGWRGHVEGDFIVDGGKRLEVGADLVGHVAATRNAVGAHDHEIDVALLHELAARIVGDERVGHAVLAELPGREKALVAGTGFIDPDVQRCALLERHVDRRERRAVVDGGKPARVAVREHVHGTAQPGVEVRDERHARLADGAAGHHVLLRHRLGRLHGGLEAKRGVARQKRAHHPAHGPGKVHGRWTRIGDDFGGLEQGVVLGILLDGEHDGPRTGDADERSAADAHGADGLHAVPPVAQHPLFKAIRQERLIDDLDGRAVVKGADASCRFTVNFHMSSPF